MSRKKDDEAVATEKTGPQEPNGAPAGEIVIEEGNDLGSIRIHNNVMAVIARLAALKVPGVVELEGGGSFVDGIAGMIGKRGLDRGIRVDVSDNMVTIDIGVNIEYGRRIPEVAARLQSDVREAVEQMTGQAVRAVNISVQSVHLPQKEEAATEELDT